VAETVNNELTSLDIKKMQEELDERRLKLMPELIEEVKRTRAFGDLSENYEYKAAKQAQNRNKGRIRYLERMIASAHVIEDRSADDEVGLFDKVELYMPDDDATETIQVVTTVRCDPLNGLISKESPLGIAVLGKKVGDSFRVAVSADYSYEVEVRSITKQVDDGSAPLLQY
jgi:transcription elongation factor GreA